MHFPFQKVELDAVRHRLENLMAYALRLGMTKEELHNLIDIHAVPKEQCEGENNGKV